MATQIDNPNTAAAPASQIDRYVGRQLGRTTRQVRFSDIVTGFLAIGSYALAFFFVVAIIDAWIWPLNHLGRGIALVLFVVGMGGIVWYALLPLFLRKINPQYAARMIEDSRPGFKNSLLNYLALKRDDRKVHRAIWNEVSKRAATDLSTVPIDSAVDKTNLIRVGFVLVALVAVSIAYLIFSPKSPFPTVMRVLAPGSKIAQPAAVRIQNVTPGDTSVFFGERQEITAQISGKCEEGDVRLVYSSKDQQVVDAVVPMEYSGSNGTWTTILETGPAGIQQPLNYYIAARDGVSPVYSIDVRPNPSISVNSIKITPPAYTKLPERTIEGDGEIQCVEGSRIEIAATANLPIDVAYIVPLIARDAENTSYRELRSITMNSEGTETVGHFTAMLNSNRDRPLFTHYKIKFCSTNDYQNDQANIYPVRVIADLAPEVEIVTPVQKEMAIPANQPFSVEIRASDLDYEISSVDLHIDHQGTKILDRNLHLNVDGQNVSERVQARMTLTPADMNLEPGDRAIMFATASDNRVSPTSQLLDPNISRTENYTLIVTDPIENPEKVKQQEADEEAEQEDEVDQPRQDPNQAGNQDQQVGDSGNEGGEQKDETTDEQSGSEQSGSEQSESEQQESDASQSNQGDSQGSQSSQPSDSGNQSREQEGGQSGSENRESESESSDGAESSQSQSEGSEAAEQSSSSQAETDSSQTRNQGGSEGQQQDGDPNEASDGLTDSSEGQQRSSNGERGSETEQNGANAEGQTGGSETRDDSLNEGEMEPLSENASESEQFERLKKYFDQKQKEQQQSENSDRPASESDSNDQPREQQRDGSGDSNSPEMEQQQTGSSQNNDSSTDSSSESEQQQSSEQSSDQQSSEQTSETADQNNQRQSPSESATEQQSSSSPSDSSQGSQPSENQSTATEQNPSADSDSGSTQEQANDGVPEQSIPDGTESQSGQPDEKQQGSGSEKSNDSQGSQPRDSQSGSTDPSDSQPKESSDESSAESETQSADSSEQSQSSQQSGDQSQSSQQPQDSNQQTEKEKKSSSDSSQQSSSSQQSGDSNQQSQSSQQSGSSNQQSQSPGEQSQDSSQQSQSGQSSGDASSSTQSQSASDQSSQSKSDSSSSASSMGEPSGDSQQSDSASSSQQNDASRTGGSPGAGGNISSGDSGSSGDAPNPEEANLEYAKKVTDLVLNSLEEQKFEPDQELLDQMNWTKEDLDKFLQQWQEMKANADSGDAESQRIYQEALRSLGLSRDAKGRKVNVKQDDPFQLNEDGAVDQIPAEYVDRFNSFLKRRNRSKRK
jgi:hypothetical protein